MAFRLAVLGAIGVLGSCDSTFGLVPVGIDAGASSYFKAVMADNPLGYYRLGITTGSAVPNEVMGGPTGMLLGAVILSQTGALTDDSDPAMGFNGQAGAVDVNHEYNFSGTASFSIECWINPASVTVQDEARAIVSRWTPPQPSQGYLLYQDHGTHLTFQRTDTTINASDSASITNLAIGTYSHVVATYDGQTILLYVNGTYATEGSSTFELPDLPLEFMIGAGNNDPTFNTFDGLIDEVAIYSYAMSGDRVTAHYQAGTETTAP